MRHSAPPSPMDAPLRSLHANETTTLRRIANGRPLVVDVWHHECPSCLVGLQVMDDIAERLGASAAFVTCALAHGDAADRGARRSVDVIADMELGDGATTHTFCADDTTALLKAAWGIRRVPFALVLVDGRVAHSGLEPRALERALQSVLASLADGGGR